MLKKNGIDYSKLEDKIFKKSYRFEDVKDRLEAVAFDIVKFKDDDKSAQLWQVQSADDGNYIVSLYQQDEEIEKSANLWEVAINKTANQLQISYKGDPIVKVAASKLGIPNDEIGTIPEYLPNKLAESKKLVKSLLNELSSASKEEVLKKYPELV